jgi:cobalt/nickel transport system permease protein
MSPFPFPPFFVFLLHIPDGFLSIGVSAASWLLILGVMAYALRATRRTLDERLIPLAGIMGAFIFAAQMINFPVAGGTSGHFIGAALAFIILGPWLGLLTMTAVVALQALLFQDGGLVVMGANILIMGLVPGFVGYQIYRLGKGRGRRVETGTTGAAAWLSIMAAALVTTLLLAFSGTTSLAVALPAMLGVHALIGIGEALITVAALAFLLRTHPAALNHAAANTQGGWLVLSLLAVLVVVLLAPFASGYPDGLEWVAEMTGLAEFAQEAPYSFLPDYRLPFAGETPLSTILAGLVGIAVVAVVVMSLGRGLVTENRKQKKQKT